MTPKKNSYEQIPDIDNEETPVPHKQQMSCISWVKLIGLVAVVVGLASVVKMVMYNPLSGQVKAAQALVKTSDFTVEYTTPLPPDATFVELANRMLPPWYEASLMAINEALQPDVITPGTVSQCRKTLLMTRNLLDAFSPVFFKHSLWTKLRKQYKKGYELVGYFQDLDHSGVDYDGKLLQKRLKAVLDWKKGFEEFRHFHAVRQFVYQQASPDSCTRHDSSHLFWADQKTLPCGHDPAKESLQNLGTVQLTSAAHYYTTIRGYDTVLEEDKVDEFHNLRKVLRIFLDEYDLFGDVLLAPSDGMKDQLDILNKAQKKLGHLHDVWTAYDIYVQEDSHKSKQKSLADEINAGWKDFLQWAHKNDLSGVIQSVSDLLQQ